MFLNYVRANALDSARRFYDRWQGNVLDRRWFQDTLGAANLSLAIIERNEARLKQALVHCAHNYTNLPEITAALLFDDLAEARKQIGIWIRDWPDWSARPAYEELRDYLALIPALCDPKHADHDRALDGFPDHRPFLFLQCILLNKAHLTVAEAERFLKEAGDDNERRLVIAALRKDREEFEDRYRKIDRQSDNSFGVLFASLRNRLLNIAPPAEQPDLMPPDATPLFAQLSAMAREPMVGVPPPPASMPIAVSAEQVGAALEGTWRFFWTETKYEFTYTFKTDGTFKGQDGKATGKWKLVGDKVVMELPKTEPKTIFLPIDPKGTKVHDKRNNRAVAATKQPAGK